jgi:hypothetical protein
MNKFKYRFMRSLGGVCEEMQYPKMDFISDAAACKYARLVLGHDCFAVKLDEAELKAYNTLVKKFDYSYETRNTNLYFCSGR